MYAGIKDKIDYLETKVDNLYVDNFKTVPADLSKLSNVVDNIVVKRQCMTNWLSKLMLLILRYQPLLD